MLVASDEGGLHKAVIGMFLHGVRLSELAYVLDPMRAETTIGVPLATNERAMRSRRWCSRRMV
jgi:hypothetical protein